MIPLMRPNPPRLSEAGDLLRQIENSGTFGNFGPVNSRFEQQLCESNFGGIGKCLTVCNATLGLMLAIKRVTEMRTPRQKYALMPSFTFAAAAQAALWCGLTPLFCDIDPSTWAADANVEEDLLLKFRGEIAVIVPYATFGFDIDLDRYERLSARHALPVVVDAAASLGTMSDHGWGFGAGFSGTVVYSMHVTKSFATGEAGVIYSADIETIEQLRMMCNFGFGLPRTATMPGLNAKLSEIGALLAQLQLDSHGSHIDARGRLMAHYRAILGGLLGFQPATNLRQAHQFAPALLPSWMAPHRATLLSKLQAGGVGAATYFSPHLAEQDYFIRTGVAEPLPITEDIANRIISLPLYDDMTTDEVDHVAACINYELASFAQRRAA